MGDAGAAPMQGLASGGGGGPASCGGLAAGDQGPDSQWCLASRACRWAGRRASLPAGWDARPLARVLPTVTRGADGGHRPVAPALRRCAGRGADPVPVALGEARNAGAEAHHRRGRARAASVTRHGPSDSQQGFRDAARRPARDGTLLHASKRAAWRLDATAAHVRAGAQTSCRGGSRLRRRVQGTGSGELDLHGGSIDYKFRVSTTDEVRHVPSPHGEVRQEGDGHARRGMVAPCRLPSHPARRPQRRPAGQGIARRLRRLRRLSRAPCVGHCCWDLDLTRSSARGAAAAGPALPPDEAAQMPTFPLPAPARCREQGKPRLLVDDVSSRFSSVDLTIRSFSADWLYQVRARFGLGSPPHLWPGQWVRARGSRRAERGALPWVERPARLHRGSAPKRHVCARAPAQPVVPRRRLTDGCAGRHVAVQRPDPKGHPERHRQRAAGVCVCGLWLHSSGPTGCGRSVVSSHLWPGRSPTGGECNRAPPDSAGHWAWCGGPAAVPQRLPPPPCASSVRRELRARRPPARRSCVRASCVPRFAPVRPERRRTCPRASTRSSTRCPRASTCKGCPSPSTSNTLSLTFPSSWSRVRSWPRHSVASGRPWRR